MSEEFPCNCPREAKTSPFYRIEKKIEGMQKRRDRIVLELVAVEGAIVNLRGFLKQEQEKESPIIAPGPQGLVVP